MGAVSQSLGWCAGVGFALVAAVASAETLDLVIDEVAPGPTPPRAAPMAFLSGRAFATPARALDVMLAIDVSDSTAERPEGGGRPGVVRPPAWKQWLGLAQRPLADPSTVLGQELELARRLVERLDPTVTRVGLVAFAGDWDPTSPDAETIVELTHQHGRVDNALEALALRGASGATNLVAGINRALSELVASRSALSDRRAARRAIVLFTDGEGVHPFYPDPAEGSVMVNQRIDAARRAGVQIDALLVGAGPDGDGEMLAAAVSETGGACQRAESAGFEQLISGLHLVDVGAIHIRNLSVGEPALATERAPDGSFAALVPVIAGRNQIEVTALGTDGTTLVRVVHYVHGLATAAGPVVRPTLRAQNRLLGRHLEDLRREAPTLAPDRRARRVRAVDIAVDPAGEAPPAHGRRASSPR